MKYNLKAAVITRFCLTPGATLLRLAILTVILLPLITGCRGDRFTITGTIEGAGSSGYLLLREVKPGLLEPVDSVIPGSDGRFTFRAATRWPAFYMLSFDDDDYLTLLAGPGDRIVIEASRHSLSRPAVITGSQEAEVIRRFRDDHDEVIVSLQQLTDTYNDSIDSPRLPLIMDSLDRRAAEIVSAFRERSLALLDENRSSMIQIYLLNQQVVPGLQLFEAAREPELFFRVDSSLYALYPGSGLVADLHQFTARLRSTLLTSGRHGEAPLRGELLPDITLPDPDGVTQQLSSLRGRVVLVDFWASWCPPCREENANLVQLWERYHSRGFDIFQVSLDLSRDEWLAAITNDRLERWKHVSDLRYRDSEVVKQFGLTEIPTSFLIDREGRVVAADLRGDELRKKVEELL